MSRPTAVVGLLFILVLAAAARALRMEHVFLDDGTVVFAIGDAFYHAHRALFSFHHFPDFLRFDPCINWPKGAPVPHAPLYDLALAGFARVLSDSVSGFERIAAWVPVGLGALTVIPVYALAAGLRGRAAGLGAACLYSVLPMAQDEPNDQPFAGYRPRRFSSSVPPPAWKSPGPRCSSPGAVSPAGGHGPGHWPVSWSCPLREGQPC